MGNLSEFLRSRTPSTLLETELRGVIKGLVDALVYLKKELVIHCNITPSKIFLTNDYGLVSVDVLHLIDSDISDDSEIIRI